MNRKCGAVDWPISVDEFAIVIHADEVRDPDLFEVHAKRIQPKSIGMLGVSCCDVPRNSLVKAEAPKQPEGSGKALLE